MKNTILFLALSLLVSLSGFAQDKPKADAKPTAALPTADDLLAKNIKAIGGEDAIRKITSRVSKGTFEIEAMNMTGAIEVTAKAPNKNFTVIELPGFGKITQVFDGAKAYSADPMSGLREPDGTELTALRRGADFYPALNYKKNFAKLEVKGLEKVGDSDAYVLLATPESGEPDKMFFDAKTYLLLKTEAERETPQGKMTVEIFYENYKTLDGVTIAHTMRQVTPAFTAAIKLSEIKQNVAVDDAKFGKPSN